MSSKFAVVQFGFCVLGVGETKEQAISDVEQYTGQDVTLDSQDFDGAVRLVECTERLFKKVEEDGGDILFEVRHGVADLVEE